MRILITNDDSVKATQLLPLIKYCMRFGDVTTVVPKVEQSGKSHGIELHNAFTVNKQELDTGIFAYVVDSTPADCVRFALLGLGKKFDLAISGINRGYNIGTDIMYSGTVAAVREAGLYNITSVALSTCPENYENAVGQLDTVLDFALKNNLLGAHKIYNINIPPIVKGVKITHQGEIYYSDAFYEVGDGIYKVQGECTYKPGNDLTLDTDAVMNGYISITPLTNNVTDMQVYKRLTE